ncbi:thioesterase II family protein [Streptomyces olivaceus]|uniref:thioesterase II family protein n=1 Tax=Streptomyces olivaceus TaxID=47716 RepID=UPI001CD02BE7|nr:alpha/beta fold hydrolase [Streptomyces olivaceus]MBZ6288471.1 alpha/beta fold hydrolase [Streptomyces olivaceus]
MSTEKSALWFRRFVPGAEEAPVRLVCLPHAGGSAAYFRPLAHALGARADVLAAQYPGRQDRRREPCIDEMGALADAAFDALRPYLDRPVLLFGHSMGATLGFELVRRIEAAPGPGAVRLFASGRRAPARAGGPLVHLLDDDRLLAELAGLDGTDARVLGDEELMRSALPAIRADYKAAETYRLTGDVRLDCPITALAGASDPKVTLHEVRAWEQHTTAGFELRVFEGGHFFLAGHREAIVRLVTERLHGQARI